MRTFEEVHHDLVEYMRAKGYEPTDPGQTLEDRATFMMRSWDWITDNTVDDTGRITIYDSVDPNIAKLLDEHLRIKGLM